MTWRAGHGRLSNEAAAFLNIFFNGGGSAVLAPSPTVITLLYRVIEKVCCSTNMGNALKFEQQPPHLNGSHIPMFKSSRPLVHVVVDFVSSFVTFHHYLTTINRRPRAI